MPEANRILEWVNVLEVLTRLGGAAEQSAIYPNAEVIDAAPADLPAEYIQVRGRSGNYEPAVGLSGVTYTPGDYVTLLYAEGAEALVLGWGAGASGEPRGNYDAGAGPTVNDDVDEGYSPGSVWVDTTNDVVYICTDATNGAAVWSTAAGIGTANPTGTVGLVAVNGVLATVMRSDAAPPLSQAINPTWTDRHSHIFNLGAPIAGGAIFLDLTSTGNAAANVYTAGIRLDLDVDIVPGAFEVHAKGIHTEIWGVDEVVNTMAGHYARASWDATGDAVGELRGMFGIARQYGTGDVTLGVGVEGQFENVLATTVAACGLRSSVILTAGAITTGYGLYIGTVQGTTEWGVYQSDASNLNYFASNVGIGTVPAVALHVVRSATGVVVGRLCNTHAAGYTGIEYIKHDNATWGAYIGLNIDDAYVRLNANGIPWVFVSGNVGIDEVTPAARLDVHVDDAAAIPCLELDQDDVSEGFINFVGSNRGISHTAATDIGASVRVEINGVVGRLALYVDA